ncbi:MAG: type II toxin-antitoxin system RelE/ParE family toxin [candidate division KSB1 bacterium]
MENHSFKIIWAGPAKRDFEKIITQIAQAAPVRAANFGAGLLGAVETLQKRPRRCAHLYETQVCRYLLYQRYRIVFYIDATKSIVYIVALLFPYQQFNLSRLSFIRQD